MLLTGATGSSHDVTTKLRQGSEHPMAKESVNVARLFVCKRNQRSSLQIPCADRFANRPGMAAVEWLEYSDGETFHAADL